MALRKPNDGPGSLIFDTIGRNIRLVPVGDRQQGILLAGDCRSDAVAHSLTDQFFVLRHCQFSHVNARRKVNLSSSRVDVLLKDLNDLREYLMAGKPLRFGRLRSVSTWSARAGDQVLDDELSDA